MDFFISPLTTKQVEWASYTKHLPSAPIDNSDVIDFTINPIRDQYIDLSKTKLYIRRKYINATNGDDLVAAEKFAPVNLPGHAMFKQCTVMFNDKHVSSGAQTFQHTCYTEILTSFKQSTKETNLRTAMWYEDTDGYMDELTLTNNKGAKERNALISASKVIEMTIKLHSPVFNIDKYIMGNVKINIKLTKASPEFYIMRKEKSATGVAGADADTSSIIFKFESIVLKVFKIKPVNNVFLAHQAILLKTPAKYILPYVDTKIFSIPQGFQSVSFDNNKYLECYEDTLECLDLWGRDKNNGITPKMYGNGYTFFTWDLTTDKSANTSNFNQPLDGTLRLEMKFSTPLTTNINIFIYGESKNMMEIDFNGQVALDHEKRKNMF